jgi:HEAT repeat protein
MRSILLMILMTSFSGCGGAQPTMAGSRRAGDLHDPQVKVRRKAAFRLGNIGPSDPVVLPALIGALQDVDPGVRCETILALLKYGPGAREAIPALTKVQEKDRDAKVRTYATRALKRLKKAD